MKAFLSFVTLFTLSSSPLHAELVLHWPLDETDGAANVTDDIGGHSGAVGDGVSFGKDGANPSTGTAAEFEGSGGIQAEWAEAINPGRNRMVAQALGIPLSPAAMISTRTAKAI